MNKLGLASLGVAAAAAVTACDEHHDQGNVNKEEAQSAIASLRALSTAMTAMDPSGVLWNVQGLARANQLTVTPTGDDGRLRGTLISTPGPTPMSGTGSCDPASCTFTEYGFGVPYIAISLSGTITRSGNTLKLDLAYRYLDKLGGFDWKISGSVKPTATSIDGTFRSRGTADPNSSFFNGDLTWETLTEYDDISLDPQGCPVGGETHIINIYEDPTGGQGNRNASSFDVEGTATFGPACGDVN